MCGVSPDLALGHYELWRPNRVSAPTWEGELPGLRNFCDYMGYRGLCLCEITPDEVDGWWWALPLADSTRHTRLSQLRVFLGWARDVRHWIEADPTLTLSARKPMTEPRLRLDPVQLLTMIDTARYPQHRIVLALTANLALRAGELRRLRIKDWWGDSIRVRVEKTREVDDMPVSSDLATELSRWLDHYGRAVPKLSREAFLVPSQYVSTIQRKVTYRPTRAVAEPEDVVKRALIALGYDDVRGEGVHTVRRSVARIFYDLAVDDDGENDALLATMKLLHHTKPETTLAYIGMDKQREARDRILRDHPFLTRLTEGVRPLAAAL